MLRRCVLLALLAGCSDDVTSGLRPGDQDDGVLVTGAEPATLPRGSTIDLRVFGSGFDERSRVVLTLNGAPTPKVRTNATLFVSPRELDASITTAADAPGGPYDIVVEGRNGKQGVGTELVDLKAHVFGISPASTEPGEPVTISGINFGSDREQVIVAFDGVGGFVQSVSNTGIVAVVPATLSPRTTSVEVRIAGVPVTPTVKLEVVRARILITGISPSTAARGDEVTITGSGFGRDRDQVHVSVGNGDAFRSGLVLSVDDTTLVAVIPFDVTIGFVLVWVSADRIPVPEPAATELTVILRRPLTGTWILTGDVTCCSFGFGPLTGQLGGVLTVLEGSGSGLSGNADVTVTYILGVNQVASGLVVGTVRDGDGSVSFTVDGRCEFTGHLVTGRTMTGALGGCADAEGTWEATRQ